MTQSFFQQGLSQDKEYEMLRNPESPSALRCRDYVEYLWDTFEPYSDKHFLSDARNHFHQRFWEMYICVSLINLGFKIESNHGVGPDICTFINGKRVWIEAVAPSAGDGIDRVPEVEMGKATWVPRDKITIRFTSVIFDKFKKYKTYKEKGIVDPEDICLIAINSNKVPHARFGSDLPYHVRALFPFGPLAVSINGKTGEVVDQFYQYENKLTKIKGSEIPKDFFTNTEFCQISGVLNSTVDVAACALGSIPWGSEFDLVHNPLASNPLPVNDFSWCKQRVYEEGVLNIIEKANW